MHQLKHHQYKKTWGCSTFNIKRFWSVLGAPNAGPGGHSPAPPPTGPDGVPIHDESSQQSTLSQSSDRSDGRQTPKAGPGYVGGASATPGYPPGSPHSSAPSPGGSLGSSGHEGGGYPRDIASPSWQRTAASPAGQQVRRNLADQGSNLYQEVDVCC